MASPDSDLHDLNDEQLFDSIVNETFEIQSEMSSIPTSNSFLKSLPVLIITASLLKTVPSTVCAICTDEFKPDENVHRLPCHHLFHQDCIIPWLNRNSTCPLCRHQLPPQEVCTCQCGRQGVPRARRILESLESLADMSLRPSRWQAAETNRVRSFRQRRVGLESHPSRAGSSGPRPFVHGGAILQVEENSPSSVIQLQVVEASTLNGGGRGGGGHSD